MTSQEFEGYEPDEERPQANKLETLALQISKGPITAKTLIPLLDALALEERREELARQEMFDGSYNPLREIEKPEDRTKRMQALQSKTISAQDRAFAYVHLLSSPLFEKILKPVLKEHFSNPQYLQQQLDLIATALKTAADKESAEKGKSKKKKK